MYVINHKNDMLKNYFNKMKKGDKIAYDFLNVIDEIEKKTEDRLAYILKNGIIFNKNHTEYIRASINYTINGDEVIIMLRGKVNDRRLWLHQTYNVYTVAYEAEENISNVIKKANSKNYVMATSDYFVIRSAYLFSSASILFSDEEDKLDNRLSGIIREIKTNTNNKVSYLTLFKDVYEYKLQDINRSNTNINIDFNKHTINLYPYNASSIQRMLDGLGVDIVSFALLSKEEIIDRLQLGAINKNINNYILEIIYARGFNSIYTLDYYLGDNNDIFTLEVILDLQYTLRKILSDASKIGALMFYINEKNIETVKIKAKDVNRGCLIEGDTPIIPYLTKNNFSIKNTSGVYHYDNDSNDRLDIIEVSYKNTTYKTKDMLYISEKIEALINKIK